MKDNIELAFKKEGQDIDILIAHLNQFNFNGFIDEEEYLTAYLSSDDFTSEIKTNLAQLKEQLGFKYYISKVQGKNWNEEWESNYEPILIDDFCAIRAHFHEPIDHVKHEIIITPQMSFGTGHHETTFMMMKEMQNIDFVGKRVFDYGCGTGVLAILAKMLNADSCLAIDYDPICAENTIENIERNNSKDITTLCGDKSIIPNDTFDVVLANINRNVLLDSLDELHNIIPSKGILLMSGIMLHDEDLMKNNTLNKGFTIEKIERKGQWICIKAVKG